MSWETFAQSEVVQRFGIALIGFAIAYLVWLQMNVHIDGRFASQDARIEHMQIENDFMRKYILDEQEARKTLFQAIEQHLKELTRVHE